MTETNNITKDNKLVEAILFAAGNRISLSRIIELSHLSEEQVTASLEALQQKYSDSESTFELTQMGNEWKFTVKREFLPIVEKIAPDTELPKAIIETLAILAWKSPVEQSEIIHIRGNKAYDHISELEEKKFIEKQKSGRTYLVKLTSKFYDYFDIDKERIDEMFAKYEGKENVAAEEIAAAEVAEAKRKEEEIAELEKRPTLDEIKGEERADQKEFFDKIEAEINAATQRTDALVGEIQKLKPDEAELEAMGDQQANAIHDLGEAIDEISEEERAEKAHNDDSLTFDDADDVKQNSEKKQVD